MQIRKNPATSLEAWRSITNEMLSDHHARILTALSKGPASAEQIAGRINLTHLQVNRRMDELFKKELVFKNGLKVATSTGRSANVWQLTQPGKIPQKLTEKVLPGPSISDYSRAINQRSYTQLNLL